MSKLLHTTSLILFLSTVAGAQSSPLDRLKEYIEVNTVNPPGNESRGVEFFRQIFDEAGISYETAESAPGRGNIWAKLEGGDAPGLVLLHHMDVVPATAAAWDTDPFKAVVKDGVLYGRGVRDTKALGIMHLEAFLALHKSGRPLARDVIFLATADEEAGGYLGAGWLVENRPEIFDGVGFLLNEGGTGSIDGDRKWFNIELAQKRPYWLRLTATDMPGHGSRPLPTSATTRLIHALDRLHSMPFPPRIVPPVREMFAGIAAFESEEWQGALLNIDSAITDPSFLIRLQAEKTGLHALVRNTCSITVLKGSDKINVVPPEASAELDCRILPDQDAGEFLDELRQRLGDDEIQIEEIMLFGAAASQSDTELYRTIETVSREYFPDAGLVPSVLTGFTDSHFFRDMGITSYGFSPDFSTEDESRSVHGNNERMSVAGFEHAVEIMTEIVGRFAGE